MSDPTIAAIIPLYNTERYIAACLQSMQAQTYPNFRCIIVNDGSTDESARIATDIAAQDPEQRFIVLNKTNGGVSSARNAALDYLAAQSSKPDLVCFIDADDLISENFFETFAQAYKCHHADVISVGMRLLFADGLSTDNKNNWPEKEFVLSHNQIGAHFFNVYPFERNLSCRSMGLCNKAISFDLVKSMRFDETLLFCEDSKFFILLIKQINNEVLCPQAYYIYRQRQSSTLHNLANKQLGMRTDAAVFETLSCQVNDPDLEEALKRWLFSIYYEFMTYCAVNKLPDGKFYYAKLIKHWKKYRSFCPVKFKSKMPRLLLGWHVVSWYSRYRKHLSDKHRLKKGKHERELFF